MHTLTVGDVGERELIARILARLAMPEWVVVGPGDDAAVLKPARNKLDVLTTDSLVEGIHFDRRFVPPDAIGHRALAVNLSDVAAMGAEPRSALLSLAMPAGVELPDVDAILDGMLRLAAAHRVVVVGGNITRSPGPVMIDVTVTGSVSPRRFLTRAGARPGDELFVTGSIGDAAVGLGSLQRSGSSGGSFNRRPSDRDLRYHRCEERYLRPQARVRAGMLLGRNRAASSCIDLSDGLADGVRQIAEASKVGVVLDAAAIPIADDVRRWHEQQGSDALEGALAAGDDYELLFTVRANQRGQFRGVRRHLGDLPITKIGVVTRERHLLLSDELGKRDIRSGFEHFK